MKNYEVPFYANTPDGTHCFQAALRMVLKFFIPEKEFTWEELDKMTAKVEGLWTWPTAGLWWLSENGFEVKDLAIFDYDQFVEKGGDQYLIELYGKEIGEKQISHSDIAQEIRLAKEYKQKMQPKVRIPSLEEIPKLLDEGYLVVCNVNSRVLNEREGYVGHFVVIKGYNETDFIMHDPGLPPQENREVEFAVFERAWAYPDDKAKNIIAFKLK